MKLTALLLVIALLQVRAEGYSQTVTLRERNAPLERVLQAIKQQTGYVFFYEDQAVRNVNISVGLNEATIDEALRDCLKDLPLTYRITEKTIVIARREPSLIEKLTTALAPPISVRGRVTDSTGTALVGATVQLDGNQPFDYAMITDESGKFAFEKVVAGEYKLTISHVGYQTIQRIITVDKENLTLRFPLKSVTTVLQTINVVVNTGYQQLSAEQVTGSVDVIKKSQFEKPTTNVAARLIGTTAGMQVTQDVDGNPTIQIRGISTLYANTRPLVVLDGFPIRNSQNFFSTINPNDIENISVLKDAAASAIWGARAANGVIVVTTRKAKKGTPLKVEFSAFTRTARKFDLGYTTGLASSAETVDFEQLAFNKWGGQTNGGTLNNDNYRESEATVALNERNLGFLTADQLTARLNQLRSQDNRQQISDYLLANPSSTQYNLTLSGGGQNISSLASLMVEQNQSNFRGTGSRKYSLNYRTTATVAKWLDVYLSTALQYEDQKNNGIGTYDLQILSPYELLKNPDGSLTDIHQYYQPIMDRFVPKEKFPYPFSYNPIQEVDNRDYSQTFLTARIQTGLTLRLLKGLTLDAKVQYENVSIASNNYNNDQTFYVRNQVNTSAAWDKTTDVVTLNLPRGGILDQGQQSVISSNFRNQLTYTHTLSADHEINVIAGSEVNSSVNQGSSPARTYGYNDNTLTVGNFPNGPTGTTNWQGYGNYFSYTNSFTYSIQRFFSVFANAAYTYRGRYTLSGSYRTDASNIVTSDPRYRYSPFYSAGLGWTLTDESFLKSNAWLNRLNLRATYGYSGNIDNSSSAFTLLSLDAAPNQYTKDYTARIIDNGNTALTWEKTRTINLGLDYALFNSRIYGKIEVYDKAGKDLLAPIVIPSVNGATFQKFNNAALSNRGIELTIGTTVPIKGTAIIWTGNLNVSYNENRITRLFNTNYAAYALTAGGSVAYQEGYNASAVWAYQYAGLVNGVPTIMGANDTKLPFSAGTPSGDSRTFLKNIGTTNAPCNLGMTNSVTLHSLTVSFIAVANFGGLFRAQYFNYPVSGYVVSPNRKLSGILNGDPNAVLTLPTNPNDGSYANWISLYPYLSYNYLSSSLLRMQEVNATYELPKRLLSRVNVGSARLIVQGNNLFTILANKTGEDPQYPVGTVKPRAQYTFGLKFDL